eukprot:TRINITY_DN36487_c0_g1_i2.p3 TRINITY_DN36487_c0_g1~~TRINITY_DN36487_c0_g1_i2.p3  ORF type:complete len:119 (-),score=17.63 TRINITY_DN36487_c0_g1_i2:79-435(-)
MCIRDRYNNSNFQQYSQDLSSLQFLPKTKPNNKSPDIQDRLAESKYKRQKHSQRASESLNKSLGNKLFSPGQFQNNKLEQTQNIQLSNNLTQSLYISNNNQGPNTTKHNSNYSTKNQN